MSYGGLLGSQWQGPSGIFLRKFDNRQWCFECVEWFEGLRFFGKDIPKLCCFNIIKWVGVARLCFGWWRFLHSRNCCLDTMATIFNEGLIEIVGSTTFDSLPCVYQYVAFSASLLFYSTKLLTGKNIFYLAMSMPLTNRNKKPFQWKNITRK